MLLYCLIRNYQIKEKFMKLNLLPIALMTLMLGACGSKEPSTPSVGPEPSTSESQPTKWQYLDFLTNKQVRFDLFDVPSGLQFSYGNFALSTNVSTSSLKDSDRITVNQNLESGSNFHLIVVTEKEGNASASVQVIKGLDCTQLQEYFRETAGDDLVGADRAYVTFTFGEKAKWTHNLNTDLDVKLNSLVG